MSEAYDDDLEAEQAIFDQIEAAEFEADALPQPMAATARRATKIDPIKVVAWRQAHEASIAATAKRFGIGVATVKRYCRDYDAAAKLERKRFECARLDAEDQANEYAYSVMYLDHRRKYLSWIEFLWFGRCLRAKDTPDEAETETAKDAALASAEQDFTDDWLRHVGEIPAVLDGSNRRKIPI